MSLNVRISVALVALFVVVVAAFAVASGGGDDDERRSAARTAPSPGASHPEPAGTRPRVVAADPRRLGEPGRGGVTFTEFLDFECEACGAAFPAIERLRKSYAGRVTFNIRYFPLPGHQNGRNAALAVEAASQQGKFEPMYRRMFETQTDWGEQSDSQADVFRRFAEDLGLNLKRFDASIANPATLRRIERDIAAGTALGVQGTPTFFLNERRIAPQSLDELREEIDAAVRQGS